MTERVSTLIMIVAVVIVSLLTITVGFSIYRRSKAGVNNAMNQMDEMNTTLAESKYTDYEGTIITGSQVQSLLNNFANDEIRMEVSGNSFNYTDDSLTTKSTLVPSKAARRDSGYYVSPSQRFEVSINRDADTNEIRAMVFTPAP